MSVRTLLVAGAASLGAMSFSASACDIALALTVDVSGSISPDEYALQMEGLADALGDPTVADAIVANQAALMVVQWSGSGRQVVSIPWREITDLETLAGFAVDVRETKRKWRHFSTAIGDALEFTTLQFADAPVCARKVIDVSGDGLSNEGFAVEAARDQTVAAGITINGLAIENNVTGLNHYYRENVVGGPGAFVLVAESYSDYPRAIRRKLLNEVVKPAS